MLASCCGISFLFGHFFVCCCCCCCCVYVIITFSLYTCVAVCICSVSLEFIQMAQKSFVDCSPLSSSSSRFSSLWLHILALGEYRIRTYVWPFRYEWLKSLTRIVGPNMTSTSKLFVVAIGGPLLLYHHMHCKMRTTRAHTHTRTHALTSPINVKSRNIKANRFLYEWLYTRFNL